MPEKELLVLESGPGEPGFNMALDEALLEAMPELGRPVLRFYGWTEPAASFGYFQKWVEVERLTSLRPLVRRPTAGGIVPHDVDWTYSLAFPIKHEWYSFRAQESYRRVHEWLQASFALLMVETELAPAALKTAPGQCFIGHECSDLLWQGKKIAGAAQRRRRDGLLIQGSIRPPATLQRDVWQQAICAAARERGFKCRQWQLDSMLVRRAEELASRKYNQRQYNEKR